MEATRSHKRLEYAGIRFGPESLCGVQGGSVYSVIPHSEVSRITLHRGSSSAHPLLQLVVGALLAAGGIPILIHLIHWVAHGGLVFSIETWFLTLPTVGVILLLTALRRSYYVTIDKRKGRARIPFDSDAKLENVLALMADARKIVNYPIEIDPAVRPQEFTASGR